MVTKNKRTERNEEKEETKQREILVMATENPYKWMERHSSIMALHSNLLTFETSNDLPFLCAASFVANLLHALTYTKPLGNNETD